MAELKPCPFCGGDASVLDQRHIFSRVAVSCQDCGVRTAYCSTIAKAVKDWNRRAEDGK